MSTVTNEPRLNLVIPDISGDGVQDFVIAHLEPSSILSGAVEVFLYPTCKLGKGEKRYPDLPPLPNARQGWVEDYTHTEHTPYYDGEAGQDAVHEEKTEGRAVTLNITDKAGVVHRQQVFIPDYAYATAAANGTNIYLELPTWGTPYVIAGQ